MTQNVLGYILGDSFANSFGHPDFETSGTLKQMFGAKK
jgi:hypothetical protein